MVENTEWGIEFIGNIFEFKNGLNKGKDYFGKGTPIINYMDIYKKQYLTKENIKGKVSVSKEEIKRFDVKCGDVFFTRTSETPEEVGISSVLIEDIQNGVFSGFVLRARPKKDALDINYCKYCFSTREVRRNIILGCTYTTRALTNGRQLSRISILTPPLKEQKNIAATLSDIDNLILSLENIIRKKKMMKQGVMQELLTVKKRLNGFNEEWVKVKLCEVGNIITGSTPSRGNASYWGGTFNWASAQDFKSKYINSTIETVTESGKKNCRIIPRKSVLVTCIASIGLNAITNVDCATNQQINAIVCNENFCSEFVYYLIEFNTSLLKSIAGQTAVPIINKVQFENVIFSFPPTKTEQLAISSVLANADEELEVLSDKLKKYQNIKQGMMQELLTGRIRLL